MIPDTWLAWYIFEDGLHPIRLHFIGLLRMSETTNMAKFENERGVEILLPEKVLAVLVPIDAPRMVDRGYRYLPPDYNSRTSGGEEVGNVVPVTPAKKYTKVMKASMGMFSE
jgi:hypothetical protein